MIHDQFLVLILKEMVERVMTFLQFVLLLDRECDGLTILVFQFLIQPVLAEEEIVLDYFYNKGCGPCKKYLDENNNGSGYFKIRNGSNTIVFDVSEAGTFIADGNGNDIQHVFND